MARKKDGKSLLDVIGTGPSKAGDPVNVPSWFDQAGQAPPAVPGAVPPVFSPAQAGPATPREPVMSTSGGRLQISLNQVSAVVLFVAIILLGVGAFILGRQTAPKAPGSAQGRIDAPLKPGVTRPGAGGPTIAPLPTSPHSSTGRRTDGMIPDDAPRQKGCSYLVIQGIPDGHQALKDAMDIKRFLYSKGIDATIHRLPHTRMCLVKDMRAFRNIRSQQTRAAIAEYVAQIERLGREYQRQGGRYNFRQSSSTGPWMITEK